MDDGLRRRIARGDHRPGPGPGRLHPGRHRARRRLRRRPFDWLTPYSLLTAAGLVCGYALLGATWLIWRTADELHGRARAWARRSAVITAALLAVVSVATLFLHPRIAVRWGVDLAAGGDGLDLDRLALLSPIPLLGAGGLAMVLLGLRRRSHGWPFIGALIVFLSGYLGLAVGFFPYVVPYALSYEAAANADNALALLLVGAGVLLPAIIGYSTWVYWIFRGKVTADAGYH